MVAGLYRVGIPREARDRVPILPGAVAAVLLIACLGTGYGEYLSRAGITNAYQGGLTVIGVTLTTLWLFSVALLLGVELNKVAGQRRNQLDLPPDTDMAGRLPEGNQGGRARWPTFAASSFRPISRRPRSSRSTGRSRSPNGLARGSR
jgi:uncharacterized BrkB/YihY/UPF0761 family membrane protein